MTEIDILALLSSTQKPEVVELKNNNSDYMSPIVLDNLLANLGVSKEIRDDAVQDDPKYFEGFLQYFENKKRNKK